MLPAVWMWNVQFSWIRDELRSHCEERVFVDTQPVNLSNFSTLVPFTDALMDEDPSLYEYLIDPHKKPYDIDVLGVRTMRLSSEKAQKVFLPAIRRGVRFSSQNRDRLQRAERLPWKEAFAEMRRIVLDCNRYPKINDVWVVGSTPLKLHMFYNYCRRGYLMHQRGEATYLQPHQIYDLESLPAWKTYGCHGPYFWKESLGTLRKVLSPRAEALQCRVLLSIVENISVSLASPTSSADFFISRGTCDQLLSPLAMDTHHNHFTRMGSSERDKRKNHQ